MSTTDKLFSGSIAEVYDRAMVPLIFEPYARDLAERASKLGPQSVLEVAAGTGVVTRAMAAKLPAQARIVVTDLNQPMLDHARTRMADDPRITWQQADAQALPFEDAEFDAVVCQFGAMFFPDRVGAYGQARRVMRPGGHFLFNVWGALEDNEFAEEVTRALGHFFPADPPRFMARTPHGYHDGDVIHADLHAAGFRDITIEPLDAVSAAPSPYDAAAAYCQGTPLRAEIEARGGSLEEATRYVANALGKRFGEGPVSGRIRALVVEAA
ncbi:methyltransferase domain-containing protein [Mesorhizobium sp. M7A.F.Ca.US.006.01.1.1]|uniref:class I SAM-dependent methyltransferase n=1 Tax=Mesorhizobium sp. M7A.F.Ca.US.006.01.1.1 TaxID=2496707 RepID=UPI000FCCD7F3|nr:class I SAM-dependent methyltransferase [Mesorhizobium sp. M7A.F.Ca.US.006.01.1.1]RUZ72121.1 methyltransferase domain-containing protein [Mesorhizobium sp. M7A.F.Ca.US.006.01.1.1]